MRKKLASTLALLSAVLILSATTSSVLAADYNRVGVKQGDIAWYTVHLSFQPDVVNACVVFYAVTPPTTVSRNGTIYFKNGTAYSVFVSTQDLGNGGNHWPALASPNLQKGDPAWIGSQVIINETTPMVVLNQSRMMVHWWWSSGDSFREYWLDQYSGLLVLLKDRVTGIYNVSWQLSYTTVQLGVATDPWVFIVIGGAAVAIVVVAALLIHKRHGSKK